MLYTNYYYLLETIQQCANKWLSFVVLGILEIMECFSNYFNEMVVFDIIQGFFNFLSNIIQPNRIWPNRQGLQNTPTESLHRSKTPQRVSYRYDSKQSDGEDPVMLEIWGMRSTSSLPSLSGPLWPGVLAPDRILCIG